MFVHGLPCAFEDQHCRADVCGAACSAVVPAGYAAVGLLERLEGTDHWKSGLTTFQELNPNVSEAILLAPSRNVHCRAVAC